MTSTVNDSENTGSKIHRLVRNADDIDALIAHEVEDDVAPFREAAVTGMNVISFATCEGITGQPLESLVQGSHIVGHLRRPPLLQRLGRYVVDVFGCSGGETVSGRHARVFARTMTDSMSKSSIKSSLAA